MSNEGLIQKITGQLPGEQKMKVLPIFSENTPGRSIELPSINKRIRILITYYAERKVGDFARKINIPARSLTRLFTPDRQAGKIPMPSTKILISILTACPDLNANWLLRGTGEVIIEKMITKACTSCEKLLLAIITEKETQIREQAVEIGHLSERLSQKGIE